MMLWNFWGVNKSQQNCYDHNWRELPSKSLTTAALGLDVFTPRWLWPENGLMLQDLRWSCEANSHHFWQFWTMLTMLSMFISRGIHYWIFENISTGFYLFRLYYINYESTCTNMYVHIMTYNNVIFNPIWSCMFNYGKRGYHNESFAFLPYYGQTIVAITMPNL